MKASERAKSPLVIVTGLSIVALIYGSEKVLYAAAIIGLLCIFSSFAERMVTEGWIRLAEGLGWVSSKVILSVVFFCILLPIAMIRRLFKGDTLHLKKENLKTLFETRDHKYVPEDLENPF